MKTALLLRLEIQGLLDHYVAVIDNDRLEQWPDFFVHECLYEIIPRENEDAGLPAPVMRCENKRMLRDRVTSLRNANIFAPQAYRHFLSGLEVVSETAHTATFSASYLVINSNQIGQSLVYQTGRYAARIARVGDDWKFVSLRCIYETSRVQTLLALPI